MIVDREQFETSYITINTTKKPLDDVRLRKAINMAINKDRIVRIVNGRATAANQVLPKPLMRPATTKPTRAILTTSKAQRSSWRRPVSRMASRPRSMP